MDTPYQVARSRASSLLWSVLRERGKQMAAPELVQLKA